MPTSNNQYIMISCTRQLGPASGAPKKRFRPLLVIPIALIFSLVCLSFTISTQGIYTVQVEHTSSKDGTKLTVNTSVVESKFIDQNNQLQRHANDTSISTNAITTNDRNQTEQNTNKLQYDTSFEVSNANEEPVLTLMVVLSGEFGNNMFKIIRAWGIARLAEQEFGLTTRLVFQQKKSKRGGVMGKVIDAGKELERCFLSPTYFQTGDFGLGNRLLEEGYFHQINSIPTNNFTLSDADNSIADLKVKVKTIFDYISDHSEYITQEININTTLENGSIVPRLMVPVDSLEVFPIVNEFYEDIRKTFLFDENKCCGKTLEAPPGEDESVLYLRNYATEIRRINTRLRWGFEELDKDRISSELLGHLKQGDKLALVGRNIKVDTENESTEARGIFQALNAKNLTLRFTPGDSGLEDFCFLQKTTKELIGTPISTYFSLAVFLAGPSLKLARFYQYVTPHRECGSQSDRFKRTVGSNWTHPELRGRIRFEEYFEKNSTSGKG